MIIWYTSVRNWKKVQQGMNKLKTAKKHEQKIRCTHQNVWAMVLVFVLHVLHGMCSLVFYANITTNGRSDQYCLFSMHNIQPMTLLLSGILLCSALLFHHLFIQNNILHCTRLSSHVCECICVVISTPATFTFTINAQQSFAKTISLVVTPQQHFAYVKFSYSHAATHQMNR